MNTKDKSTRAPNFMIAGEQKAGTSYLQASLRTHPCIFMSRVKEPMFFSQRSYRSEDLDEYLQTHFRTGTKRQWVGEASSLYFHSEEAGARIREAFGPDIKFIICMRNPVEKAVSLFLHNFRLGRLSGSECLADLESTRFPVLPFTRHADASTRLIDIYSRRNLHFILFDTLRCSAADFVNSALSFLGLAPHGQVIDHPVNKGFDLVWDGDFLTLPGTVELEPGQVPPRLSRAELLQFHELAQADIERTAQITGLDLSTWADFPESALGSVPG